MSIDYLDLETGDQIQFEDASGFYLLESSTALWVDVAAADSALYAAAVRDSALYSASAADAELYGVTLTDKTRA